MVQWTDKPIPRTEASRPEPQEEERPRPRRPSPPPHKRTSRAVLQVAVICSIFGLILASYLLFSYVPNTPAQAIREPLPTHDQSTGRIIVSDRTNCREIGFNNYSGQTTVKGTVACTDAPPQPGDPAANSAYRHPTNRLETIRRSFSQ